MGHYRIRYRAKLDRCFTTDVDKALLEDNWVILMSGRREHVLAIVIVADVLRVAVAVVVVVVALLGNGVLFLLLILLSRFAFTALEIHFFLIRDEFVRNRA